MLRGELEGAVRAFLCDTEGETHEEARLARDELRATSDFSKALNYFPRQLRLERMMLAHLAKKPDDFPGALRALPRSMLLMFVHAVQSHIFNLSVSERIAEGALELELGEFYCGETLGLPDTEKMEAEGWVTGKLIGYQSALNPRETAILERLGLRKEDFRVKALPEIASKGAYRTILAPMKDFYAQAAKPECMEFRFSLQSGSYATMAMREFMKGG